MSIEIITPQGVGSSTFTPPPLNESLCLPDLFQWHAQHSPHHIVFITPVANSDIETRTISWSEANRFIVIAAKLFQRELGKQSVPIRSVVGIFGNTDSLTYALSLVGLMRAGYVPLLISPRNSAVAITNFIVKGDVRHLLLGREAIFEEVAIASFHILRQQHPAHGQPTTSKFFNFKDFSESDSVGEDVQLVKVSLNDILFYLHSSGTTSFPKLIPYSARAFRKLFLVPWFGERDLCGKIFSFHSIPMFHGLGPFFIILCASSGCSLALLEPSGTFSMVTPQKLISVTRAADVDLLFIIPSILEMVALDKGYVEWLSTRAGVIYGGGPLNADVGNALVAAGVKLINVYGATEIGCSQFLAGPLGNDWQYFKLNPLLTYRLGPRGERLFELIVISTENAYIDVPNCKIDGQDAYLTNDIVEQHPSRDDLYRVYGRADDQIMHSNGEKTNPGPLEAIMTADPHIKAAVMFGRGKLHAGVIIEPQDEHRFDTSDKVLIEKFKEAIWPAIEKANSFAPQHSRIFKEMILVMNIGKPSTYTAKNTPRRHAIISDYEAEIEELYSAIDDSIQSVVKPPAEWTPATTESYVSAVVHSVITHKVQKNDDFFEFGCDSLQATWIQNALRQSINSHLAAKSQPPIPTSATNFVYAYPSIALISAFVLASINGGQNVSLASKESQIGSMRAMLENLISDLPSPMKAIVARERTGDVLLITGTTGGLGCHLLQDAFNDPNTVRVFALNRQRASGLLERQRQVLVDHGLDGTLVYSEKVILLEGELTAPCFGLEKTIFEELSNSVTHIIHNAWRVDFNVSLNSFKSNLDGLRKLIDISLPDTNKPGAKLVFVSSVGVLSNKAASGPVVEDLVEPEAATVNGYAQSKWIAEKMLEEAAKKGLDAQVVRVGQLAGAANGLWNTKEWFPALVQAGQIVGCLPQANGVVSWISLPYASKAVSEMRAATASQSSVQVVHVAHPRPVEFNMIMSTIVSELSLSLVCYANWIEQVEHLQGDSGDDKGNVNISALRLLPFFQGILHTAQSEGKVEAISGVSLDLSKACVLSRTLGEPELPQISVNDVVAWIKYWRSVYMLQ